MTPGDSPAPAAGSEAVRHTYDRIADHFARTRAHPWPEVESFLADRPANGLGTGVDVGCGNGRHLEPLADLVDRAVGADVSRAVLWTAVDRVGDREDVTLLQADAGRLPLATDTAELGLYVATLHHLPGRERRLSSLDELARVLGADGRALVSAWSTTHDRFDRTEGFDTTVDWTLPDGERVGRFYHVYDPAEFERDLADSALGVERTFVSSGNCYARVSG
ncbi:SAM-dependent methyltransferase [Halobacteriales archaeon SW_5_70_135]|nr:MAG: SAM-dependent methyltransferase [Halobacteriales archaeon SW_5_70_135]